MLIHFIWHDSKIPKEYDKFIDSWAFHHPTADIKLWTFDDGMTLLSDFYPEVASIFEHYEFPIQKANALRYALLHMYGGIYTDLDMMCLKPLDEIYESNDAFIGKHNNRYICNAVMGSIPGHEYWKRLMDGLPEALEWMSMSAISIPQRAIHSTGSPYMETLLPEFIHSVKVYTKEYFYPVGCHDAPEFYSGSYPNAYTMHYWNYSWGRDYNGTRDHILKMV